MGTVVALSGQVGGAKLADGLRRLRGKDLAVIVNTGDDHEVFGLAFSPDIDTMLYTLGGIASPAAGWEPAGETYVLHDMLHHLGGPKHPPERLPMRPVVAPAAGYAPPTVRAGGGLEPPAPRPGPRAAERPPPEEGV